MKSSYVCLLLLFILSSCVSLKDKENAKNIAVMTYNIKMSGDNGLKSWTNRSNHVIKQMKEKETDVYLLQEPLKHQIDDILYYLKKYNLVGIPRIDNQYLATYNAVLYNAEKLEVKEEKTFWVSETPLLESKGWDASRVRIVTYVLLENKLTKSKFYVFNVHLDREGSKSKIKGVQLIDEWIKKVNIHNYPVVIGGDFNSKENSEPIVWFSDYYNDAKTASMTSPKGPLGTFNYFNNRTESHKYRLDYIFVNESVKVNSYEVLQDKYGEMYPSDHYPVFVELTLP